MVEDTPTTRVLLISKDASVDSLSSHEGLLAGGGGGNPSRRNMIIEEESYS